MAKVYKNATTDKMDYANVGFDIMPISVTGGNVVVFKDIKIPFEDSLIQSLVKQYDSDDWQSNALPLFKKYYDSIGYKFAEIASDESAKKVKRLKITNKTKERLCTWRVEMDFDDGYLRMSPFDITFPYSFYGADALDEYAGEIVEELKSKGIIEESELDA